MKALRDDEIEVILKEAFGCVSSDDLWLAQQICKEIEKRNRWIPVSERLPDENKRYLVTHADNQVYDMEYKHSNKWLWDEDAPVMRKIIAWKELPEPFKN